MSQPFSGNLQCQSSRNNRSCGLSCRLNAVSPYSTQCPALAGSNCWLISALPCPALHGQLSMVQTGKLFQHKPEAHVRPLGMKQEAPVSTVSTDALLIHIIQQSTSMCVPVQITRHLFNNSLQKVAAWSSQPAASQNPTCRKGPGCKTLQPVWQASKLCWLR